MSLQNDNPIYVSENDPSTASAAAAQPTATTTINNDESVEVATMPYVPIHADYLSSGDSGFSQDIKDFLAKPIELQTGVIQSTDTSTTFALMDVLQLHLATTPAVTKVTGFLGIRATQVFRLQINANRMQQGRYILYWIPMGGAGKPGGSYSTELLIRRTNKTTVTQLPHVEIDINNTTEAILEVPFVSALPYYPLGGYTGTNHSLGVVGLYPYSPLSVPSGSATASYSIYSHLKDVTLVGPTVPQMAILSKSLKPTGSGSTPLETEQAEAGIGPITGLARNVKKASDSISAIFPSLSAITAPVSWAADIAGGIASVFGWSNPTDLSEVSRAIQTVQPYGNNCDMIDASMPLSLFARNQIEILPGFAGNDIDEMSIDYIKTIPAYINTFTFTTSNNIGDELYNLPMQPSAFYTSFADTGPQTIKVNTPISFLSKMFQYWRGSVRLTLKIVKTEFHSGRLELVYIPQEPTGVNGAAATSSTRDNRAYVHREIIDIRQGNQIDILIPYISIVPWREVADTLGSIQVYVINPLVAPANVSSTVTFLVEVAAGEDMLYAVPRGHSMYPVMPTAPQMSFTTKSNQHNLVANTIGNSNVPSHKYLESRVCIGEQVLSLAQVLKHRDIMFEVTTAGANTNLFFDPFGIASAYNNAGAIVGLQAGEIPDNWSLIHQCYLFSRGGVRIASTVAASTSNTFMPVTSFYAHAYQGAANYKGFVNGTAATTTTPFTLHVFQNEVFRGGAEIQVPQYGRCHSRINNAKRYFSDGTTAIVYATVANQGPQVNITFSTVGLTRVLRQAADDYQLGFWLCVPPTQVE
jgi:hypothetical protein